MQALIIEIVADFVIKSKHALRLIFSMYLLNINSFANRKDMYTSKLIIAAMLLRKILLAFFLRLYAIRPHINPIKNLNININGADVIYIGFNISKSKDPIAQESPPINGPSNKPDIIQKTFPKCIIDVVEPIGMGTLKKVEIKTNVDISPIAVN